MNNNCIHALLPVSCPLASTYLALTCTSEYTYLINSYQATTVTCALDVKYIIFSWATETY